MTTAVATRAVAAAPARDVGLRPLQCLLGQRVGRLRLPQRADRVVPALGDGEVQVPLRLGQPGPGLEAASGSSTSRIRPAPSS